MRPPTSRRTPAVLALTVVLAACSTVPPTQRPASPTPSIPGPTPAATPAPATSPPRPQADVALDRIVPGLTAPVALVAAPDESGRSFVVDQTGVVSILRGDDLDVEPFLDIRDLVVELDPNYDERGLLGLAPHPAFATAGRFYVYYSAPLRAEGPAGWDHTNRLVEYRLDPGNPERADPDSARLILEFDQPQANHSGGALGFGPDGFLYLGTGDGGGRGDADAGHAPQGNAQDPERLNGKLLRLDVDLEERGRRYGIPPDNPFASGGGQPEIFALGFRNPWRLAFEPDGARRLIVSDVGYGRYEEIDVVERGGNYGWRIREGAHCLDLARPLEETDDCPATGAAGEPLVNPVVEYRHDAVGVAVVGGYVYRGSAIPALRGRYVFADFSAQWTDAEIGRPTLLVATPSAEPGVPWDWRRLVVDPPLNQFVSGMGEDAEGELYLLIRSRIGPVGRTGEIARLVAPPG